MSIFESWSLRERARSRKLTALTFAVALLICLAGSGCGMYQGDLGADPPPENTPTRHPQITQDNSGSTSHQKALVPDKSSPDPSDAINSLPSISILVNQVKPWVASISVESLRKGVLYDFTNESSGSGLVVSADGYIATNLHVVDGAQDIMAHLPNGESYEAVVVGGDRVTDLAVLKINAQNLPSATFERSERLNVGDWVITVGNALALKGGPTVTLGIVSGLGRTIDTERGQFYGLIQTDAAINSGNSGGPLINLDGKVVGINQAMQREGSGIGFAIGSSVAVPIIDSLIKHGHVARPLIGLIGQDVTPAIANELRLPIMDGVVVAVMSRDGPAYQAGIRIGDVITKIDDIRTPDTAQFLSRLWTYAAGDVVKIEYFHNGEALVATVELAERP